MNVIETKPPDPFSVLFSVLTTRRLWVTRFLPLSFLPNLPEFGGCHLFWPLSFLPNLPEFGGCHLFWPDNNFFVTAEYQWVNKQPVKGTTYWDVLNRKIDQAEERNNTTKAELYKKMLASCYNSYNNTCYLTYWDS